MSRMIRTGGKIETGRSRSIAPPIARLLLALAATLPATSPGLLAAPEKPAKLHEAKSHEAKSVEWKTVAASGQVESTRPEAEAAPWAEVQRGDYLEPLSRVRTGLKGRATLVRRADVVRLERESLVALPAPGSDDESITQHSGSVVYQIETGDSQRFKVVTPYLTAGVKGTTFMVSVGSRWAAVTVREGVVEVDDHSGEPIEITAGNTVFVDVDGEAPSTVVPHAKRHKVTARQTHAEAHREALPTSDLQKLARAESRKLKRSIEQAQFQVVSAQALTDAELELFHRHRGRLTPSQDELSEDLQREMRDAGDPEGHGSDPNR